MNSSKAKGDRAELEAVAMLRLIAGDLLVEAPERMLGAGRRDDVGDLRVFADVAVQIKAFGPKYLAAAIRDSASTAAIQAANGRMPLSLGLVRVPGRTNLRWLASVTNWPDPNIEPVGFGQSPRALKWLQGDGAGQVAVVRRTDAEDLYLAAVEVWVDAYRVVSFAAA